MQLVSVDRVFMVVRTNNRVLIQKYAKSCCHEATWAKVSLITGLEYGTNGKWNGTVKVHNYLCK